MSCCGLFVGERQRPVLWGLSTRPNQALLLRGRIRYKTWRLVAVSSHLIGRQPVCPLFCLVGGKIIRAPQSAASYATMTWAW